MLAGALFSASGNAQEPAQTVVIAITGIHGNFYSNPFYYNVGDTLNAAGIDFVYAQTCDAFGQMRSVDVHTEEQVLIGSWNERFSYTVDDVGAWMSYAEHMGYEHVVLAGHSLGANKVIRFLSQTHDPRVDRFLLLSPCNVRHLTSVVTSREREVVRSMVKQGRGQEMLPFALLGWIECVADTAHDWLFSDELDNVHVEADADFGQVASIGHEGALLIGTYDTFTYGDPSGFLANINDHFPHPERNKLVFIEGTGHTYQQKEREMADDVLELVQTWEAEGRKRGECAMPFIVARVNTAITTEQELELKAQLGRTIGLVPGKSEEYLLVDVEDKCHLFLAGDGQTPLAYLEVSVFGNEGHAGYAAFTKAVTQSFAEVLGIAPDHVYLRFSDIAAWGVSGQYIDRRMFG